MPLNDAVVSPDPPQRSADDATEGAEAGAAVTLRDTTPDHGETSVDQLPHLTKSEEEIHECCEIISFVANGEWLDHWQCRYERRCDDTGLVNVTWRVRDEPPRNQLIYIISPYTEKGGYRPIIQQAEDWDADVSAAQNHNISG